jgi:hypothetical protein
MRALPTDGLYLNQTETELKPDEKTIGLPLRCGKLINRKLSLSGTTYQALRKSEPVAQQTSINGHSARIQLRYHV